MEVRELIHLLGPAPQDATVLLLPAGATAGEAEVVRAAITPAQPWVRARRTRPDGSTDDFYHPVIYEPNPNFEEQTDGRITENVVVLVASADASDLGQSMIAGTGRLSMATVRAAALERYREMLTSGDLLREADFRARLGVSEEQLAALVRKHQLFALTVGWEKLYPAIFCNEGVPLRRLSKIAAMLAPLLPAQRLSFLESKNGALGGRTPIEMLTRDTDFRKVRQLAAATAAEASRTFLKIFEASQQPMHTQLIAPLYTAAMEGDPRRPLWARALEAIRSPGYQSPHDIPVAPHTLLMVVERHLANHGLEEVEAWVDVKLDADGIRFTVAGLNEKRVSLPHYLQEKPLTVIELADVLVSSLAERSKSS
ncbi:antitoxin Xre/MbcA/ParS toxin-binding domain-containing protein [Caballeronia sp. LZ001]|uniref:antitoxin Xre/MbcA/ParS toxin-binding domain-containing protein n=1 Tax=Caballeronia sp. LZ001 TaxID=3038553 RepID=UPI0028636544|nr:antitoxin Xre/MbcA/ParS toxin-binding domain-containing protein [Caballeronia sp. LZ001]MDR5803754.1 DUF2384 domain-containing protein [Caballeronia sp. LZ001]